MTDLSHDATDDGFHEIQLSGKQLVFLFMATTVVSVVIFLCGVLVGRNVRSDVLVAAGTAKTPLLTSGAGVSAPAQPMPSTAPEVPAAAERPLTYNERLNAEKPVSETLTARKEPEPRSSPEAPKASSPAARGAKEDTPAAATATAQPEQPGVWAVQVVALTDRAAATAVVQRLHAKGYPAFLVTPQTGAPVQNYKVQVGKFEDRTQAEQIAGRLKKEEQFQPWILR